MANDVATYLKPPTSIGVAVPVSKPIPSGKSIIWVATGLPQAVTILKGLKAAAATLGWSVKSITYDPTNPATINSSLESAIAQKPAAIVLNGLLTPQFNTQISKASAAHIPLIPAATPDAAQANVYPVLNTDVMNRYAGKILADVLLSDAARSGSAAHVLQLTVPAVATYLKPEDDGLKAELAVKCPDCTRDLLNISLPDVFNGNYTHQVVSYLQSHSDIKYIVSDSGQLEDGLAGALQQTGITDVKRYGISATNVQINELRNGQPGGWVVQAYQEQGWVIADQVARVIVGDPTNLWDGYNLGYVLTATNANRVDPNDPEFPADYPTQFKKLWNK